MKFPENLISCGPTCVTRSAVAKCGTVKRRAAFRPGRDNSASPPRNNLLTPAFAQGKGHSPRFRLEKFTCKFRWLNQHLECLAEIAAAEDEDQEKTSYFPFGFRFALGFAFSAFKAAKG